MAQYDAWENEYRRLSLLTGKPEPQNDVIRFLKFLKKKEKIAVNNLHVLDLGSGTGRNTNYLESLGNDCVGLEISDTAINTARERALKNKLMTKFIKHDIGSLYPFPDNKFDLILDVTSSNSLNEKERNIYLEECNRALKTGGHFFVKTLCKDGDKNAQNLLKLNPGEEKDTYIIKEIGLIERVFSRDDFIQTYSPCFQILSLEKKTTYTKFNGRSYKRNFWIAYLKK